MLLLWLALYASRALVGHLDLQTSAYDLSIFDYAIADLAAGGRGQVSFIGHAIYSDHAMVILALLAPIYWLVSSPVTLVLLQPLVAGAAAWTFHRFMIRDGAPPWLALCVMVLFLFARRTHSAMAGVFYPEVFQTLLTFVLVFVWTGPAWRVWLVAVLLLFIKEDSALYVGGLAAYAFATNWGSRRRALSIAGAAVVWFVVALLVLIPASRRADDMPAVNALWQVRYGATSSCDVPVSGLVRHLLSRNTTTTLTNMAVTTGLLPFVGASWLIPAVPGLVANLAASPDTLQSHLIDHYAWPVLPWLYVAVFAGAMWLHRRWPRAARIWLIVVVVATVADNPAVQRALRRGVSQDASTARAQLATAGATMTPETSVLAQANLIPHLPRSRHMFAAGGDTPPSPPDLVLLTRTGNTWPQTTAEIEALITRYRTDTTYRETHSGPLFVFERRK